MRGDMLLGDMMKGDMLLGDIVKGDMNKGNVAKGDTQKEDVEGTYEEGRYGEKRYEVGRYGEERYGKQIEFHLHLRYTMNNVTGVGGDERITSNPVPADNAPTGYGRDRHADLSAVRVFRYHEWKLEAIINRICCENTWSGK